MESFFREFVGILESVLKESPQKRILFLARYQGGDEEIVIGVIKLNDFLGMLNSKNVFFNVCYIIEMDSE